MASMWQIGFLGTEAPLYMDIFLITMVCLPIVMGVVIWQAIQKRYGLHILMQIITFLFTLVLLGYVEYLLYIEGGFDSFVKEGVENLNTLFSLMLFHSLVALVMMILWFSTIWYARADRKRRALPGLYSKGHKRMGKMVLWSSLLLTLSVMLLYGLLFVI